jgi:hypothetical protein
MAVHPTPVGTFIDFQPGAKVICRRGWDRMFGTPEFFTDYLSLSRVQACAIHKLR